MSFSTLMTGWYIQYVTLCWMMQWSTF